MKIDINKLKQDIKRHVRRLVERALELYYAYVQPRVHAVASLVRTELIEYPRGRERNRRLILFFAGIFIADYLMYCLHTNKNIADIFPEIPSLTQEKKVSVYLPALDGATIMRETREIPVYDSDEKTAKFLFETVVKGSLYDNTAMAVPAGLFVRKVWIDSRGAGNGRVCVIDLEPAELRPSATVIKNSERLFRRAVEKTITENIPAIKTVLVLEKGVPGTALWEL
ncbi:MAG TPA: GerMN domain-containing protein [Spirochaetota bacterium]|nr:GerMN domain-containing protein [Spirochaetota bacterium]HPV42948.1 GerMN domain-containing protein [Spirochaetota bacterium]